ncbi:hypothetical protein AMAG_07486 [Allomyces macrogynus ATCC 38327]|uniref:RNB domain-containing protein n=1 Tax=Allomyces macrogynus (strain ATCC 38327) TaxID=578462 RepID=A0A0L0SIB1_ALLM3|nr:hypothetical protein AMAG_07486 [Allomyces macrogynus ATCC 38327]|eukprot:KNE62248.1 hypothetical protein AMAG_07486 [Allomyces macrogynus ATCC 38327]
MFKPAALQCCAPLAARPAVAVSTPTATRVLARSYSSDLRRRGKNTKPSTPKRTIANKTTPAPRALATEFPNPSATPLAQQLLKVQGGQATGTNTPLEQQYAAKFEGDRVRQTQINVDAFLNKGELALGDYVLVVRKGKLYHGVVSKVKPAESLLMNGFYLAHNFNEIYFRFPGFFSPHTANAHVQLGLRQLMRTANAKMHENELRMQQIHFEFAEMRGLSSAPLLDVAAWVFHSEPDLVTLEQALAVTLYAIQDQHHFVMQNRIHVSNHVTFRPPHVVRVLAEAQKLARSGTDPFEKFVTKCRAVVAAAPGAKMPFWTKEDHLLIDCLREFALAPRYAQAPFAFLSTHVLIPLGYQAAEGNAALQLLIDLRVFHRYDNFSVFASDLPLERHGNAASDAAAERMESLAQDLVAHPNADDSCAAIRHDFGSLPVYTIDDASAKEIDDGVSIEYDAATGEPSWVHIHVADPSAAIPLTHDLTVWAHARTQTVYLPETHFPMLPPVLGTKLCSIGASQQLGRAEGDLVLTVSVKLDGKGEIRDYRIRPARVHNVVSRTYDAVDATLPPESDPERAPQYAAQPLWSDPVRARPAAATTNTAEMTPAILRDLAALEQIANRHMAARNNAGAFQIASLNTSVDVFDLHHPATPRNNLVPLTTLTDLPTPAIRVELDSSMRSRARRLVAELMILAGRVAAIYATDRHVAVPFRGQPAPPAGLIPLNIDARKSRSLGNLAFRDSMTVMPFMAAATHDVVPVPHFQLGLNDGYAKVTSPLRRFGDLVAHHQIKAQLLRDAGIQPPTVSGATLPLPSPALAELLQSTLRKERQIRTLQKHRLAWWALECLRVRVDSAGEAVAKGGRTNEEPSLVEYTARISRVFEPSGAAMAVLADAGVTAFVKPDRDRWPLGALRVGDWVRTRIAAVDPLARNLEAQVVSKLELDPAWD